MASKDWFNNSVVYQVFIDRFFGFTETINANKFLGGNLKGVTQKIDYLAELGVNVIWLSPFYETISYHGYHITNYRKVEPRFGTEKDLKELIQEANKSGLRVIADFVPNHCSNEHPFFKEAIANKDSKYRDWFLFKKNSNDYLCFLHFKELPKFNLENEEAKQYMIDTANHWLSFGLDGFRIDHVVGPPHSFWKDLNQAVNQKYPQAILIGEAWAQGITSDQLKTTGLKNKFFRKIFGVSQEKVQLEYYKELDGVMDFALREILIDAVKKDINILSDEGFKKKVKKHFDKIPQDYTMVTFLDNHDTDRFLRHCGGKIDLLLNAFELLFSLGHPVVIYNGTENCVYNADEVSPDNSHSDLQVRSPFDWGSINQEFTEGLKSLIKKYRY